METSRTYKDLTIHSGWGDTVTMLSDEQAGQIFKALFDIEDETLSPHDPTALAVFLMMRNRITEEAREQEELTEEERNGTKVRTLPEKPKKTAPARFKAPTVEEVREYCIERNNHVDAESFVNFYESKGWKVGKNPMKDWKAAVRTWEKNDYRSGRTRSDSANDYLMSVINGGAV